MSMLAAIAFAAFRAQAQTPVLPPSCSPLFQQVVLSVEEALQKEDFKTAAARLALLPTRDLSVKWDDSKVPPSYRAQFQKAASEAARMWQGRLPGLTFTYKNDAKIRISFEPVLSTDSKTHLPLTRAAFFGEDPKSPRLDFVIGLKRGNPLKQTEEMDVFDDVAYCIGTYLGVADGIGTGEVMSPSNQERTIRTNISGPERTAAFRNLTVVSDLKIAVTHNLQVTPSQPALFLDPKVIESEPAIQGDRVEFHVQLSNHGDGPLSFLLSPECGCTVVTDPGIVAPQSSRLVALAVDTRMFSTDITKSVTVFTNDPKEPVQKVTLKIKLQPRYRLIAPIGDTFDLPTSGLKYPIYLIPAPGSDIEPVSLQFSGLPGATVKTSFTKWEGMLADPDRNEGPKLRKGFKIVIDMKGDIGRGRIPGTLQILTANTDYPNLTYSFYAQKGIIALPEVLPMGEVGRVPKTVSFIVSRPSAAFKILKVSSNSPLLKAYVASTLGPGEYKVSVEYSGQGRSGELVAAVSVLTNDPHQPVIEVPVGATIQ